MYIYIDIYILYIVSSHHHLILFHLNVLNHHISSLHFFSAHSSSVTSLFFPSICSLPPTCFRATLSSSFFGFCGGQEEDQLAFVLPLWAFSIKPEASLREPTALDTSYRLLMQFATDGFITQGEPIMIRLEVRVLLLLKPSTWQ